MLRCWTDKLVLKKTGLLKNESGLSLIELLMAMLVLMLIVFAFTPFLVGSIDRVHYAGDKSEALYEGQSDIEVDIAERLTVDGDKLEFVFTINGDEETVVSFEVPGGFVDVEKEKGRASAWLSGFVPYVPTMSLSPSIIIEGYDDGQLIIAEGTFTDFEKAEVIYIAESLDTELEDADDYSLSIVSTDPQNNKEVAEFYLDEGLTNSNSPYIAFCKWQIDPDKGVEITVRARLYVDMPKAIAVGSGQRIIASTDGREVWNERSHDLTGSGRFTDVTWTGSEYFLSTVTGRIAYWKNREEPRISDHYTRFNSVAYGDRIYIAAGDGGRITMSTSVREFIDGNTEEAEVPGEAEGVDLNYITWGGGKFIAVGDNGTILYSTNPADYTTGWELFDWGNNNDSEEGNNQENNTNNDNGNNNGGASITDYNFNSVAYGGPGWIAVGKDNATGNAVAVKFNPHTNTWEDLTTYLPDNYVLNDITYDDDNQFVAVGDNGTVITSPNGTDWASVNAGTDNNLLAIDWGYLDDITDYIDYIIVGEDAIVTSIGEGIDNLVKHPASGGATLHGVAMRWTP